MRILAIETATQACSVALIDTGQTPSQQLIGHDHQELGRGHAEALVPMIAALPDKGRADRIHVSLGPGSFTGVRIGIATARALGVAWRAQVLGYRTLSLIARMDSQVPGTEHWLFETGGPQPFLVCMTGGHGEWFVQAFNEARQPIGKERSMPPDLAIAEFQQDVVIGSAAEQFVELRGRGKSLHVLPNAVAACYFDESELYSNLTPIYGRAPDAKPQAKRVTS